MSDRASVWDVIAFGMIVGLWISMAGRGLVHATRGEIGTAYRPAACYIVADTAAKPAAPTSDSEVKP